MKFFESACLKLFSIIIFICALVVLLMTFKMVEITLFTTVISYILAREILLKITIVVLVTLLVLSARFILFGTGKDEFKSDGIILENASGKLIISKESLENMILNSTKTIDGLEYVNCKIGVDKEHKLSVYVVVNVQNNIIVKDVSKQLQDNIKENMKNTADLDVSAVSITIRNIVNKKNKIEKVQPKKEENI